MQRKAGLCVDGKLEGKTARMIVDTGSNISIVTTQLLRNIVKDLSCVKPVPNCLRSVTGEKLNLLGIVTLKLKIGKREILQLFYVADINESCILGLCSCYRDSDAENAFQHLKCLLTNTPVLSFLRDEGTLVLDTDASGVAIGAVPTQKQGNEEKVIAYFSRSLDRTQRQYCTTRRELLAVVKSLAYFHPYLYGRKFVVRTDHSSLRWLMNFKCVGCKRFNSMI